MAKRPAPILTRPTQVDIAKACGLDVSSVNKILNDRRGPVFEKSTIQYVKETARKMGYKHPSTSKRHLLAILRYVFPDHLSAAELAAARGLPADYIETVRKFIARF